MIAVYSTKTFVPSTMRQIKHSLLVVLVLLFASSCEKAKVGEPDSTLVTTEGPFTILHVGATVGGDYDGEDSDLRERGICYSTSPNPTTSSPKRTSGIIPNVNTTWNVIAGQSPDTKYYARAYVITKEGETHYGNEVTFTTLPLFSSPVFTNDSFRGTWKNTSSGTPTATLQGSANGFTYQTITGGTHLNALQQGFIKIGDYYIKNLVKQGTGWKCDILWRRYYTSGEVIEVKYGSNSTLTMSNDGKSVSVTGTSPFDGATSSITFYRE
jgi:hypothetical protein